MVTRRSLLRGALAAVPLSFLWRRRANAAGFGPLVPDPDGLLDLPEGFSYVVLDRRGDVMDDGYRVPGAPDGMACFAGPNGTLLLMRNHELSAGISSWGPLASGQAAPPHGYDFASQGGVTRVVLDAATLERVSSNLVLYGTVRNCGGGMTPWGWLTCEEDVSPNHGYTFLCPTSADQVQPPQRIDGYGRMNHEAAVVDPATSIAYLTEDRPDSCLYRFLPVSPATPFDGQLQALRVVGVDCFDTGHGHAVGDAWPIGWVDIDDPTPADDTCRVEGRDRGAATFVRGEGAWFHDGSVYFSATAGGPLGAGQVFRLDPDGDGGTLTLIAQSDDQSVLDYPDGVTVAPWGDVFLCEDGGGEQRIRVVDAEGNVTDFATKRIQPGEIAGACFSPDGQVLFVNFHAECFTLAITGPFPQTPVDQQLPPPSKLPPPGLYRAPGPVDGGCGGEGDGPPPIVLTAAAAVIVVK
jgi:uncharacterized repeat protein (TIGR03803 family)